MTNSKRMLTAEPTWEWQESIDHFVTIGGVNFRLSEYAGASARESNTRIVLKSGKELIACVGFYDFMEFLSKQISKA